MAKTRATAPGKTILFGEHAVVYGQPAIAAPLSQVRATAIIADSEHDDVRIVAPDVGRAYWLATAAEDDPLAATVRLVEKVANISRLSHLTVTIHSRIPIASGLGSGAATTVALIRALGQHLDCTELASNDKISELAYQIEKLHHGTPSGIDNTVIAFEHPVYFVRRQPQNQIETFKVARPLNLLVADTGVRSATREVVGDVRQQWLADPAHFKTIFSACGQIANAARLAIETGDLPGVARLMNENQVWLQQMTVSSLELDRLVEAALAAGAMGAKLSGAGRGGNMIALVDKATKQQVREALKAAGALHIISSVVS